MKRILIFTAILCAIAIICVLLYFFPKIILGAALLLAIGFLLYMFWLVAGQIEKDHFN